MPPSFPNWFSSQTDKLGPRRFSPHPWQTKLASAHSCDNRLIRVPTGLGKTLGVLAAWSYNRLVRDDPQWPRRLVLCLPMRVPIEPTQAVAQDWLRALGRLWEQVRERPAADQVGVHLLLGGAQARAWHLFPEHEAILIGTHDMLLSRALNRGYGAPRGRWPMEQALLRQDALWVFDEVPLMGVGLRTSVQLQAFSKRDPRGPTPPLRSWWMSATLQPRWFETLDFADELQQLRENTLVVSPVDRQGELFEAQKPLLTKRISSRNDRLCTSWANTALRAHLATPISDKKGRLTLLIANTVRDARALFEALLTAIQENTIVGLEGLTGLDLRLVHSRFRARERAQWRQTFLHRNARKVGVDRIIVATQVIEAGVDISADTLVTALAPWPSLVQRFGRAGRYGGNAQVIIIDRALSKVGSAPYEYGALQAALEALKNLQDVGLGPLEALDEDLAANNKSLLRELYPYEPLHTLSAQENADLFDTGPDLTGTDLDISRFIRSDQGRDLQVWWWPIGDGPPTADLQPNPGALCPVPVALAQSWICPKEQPLLPAWQWSYLEGAWRRIKRASDLSPGQLLLVDADSGGYLEQSGFVGADSRLPVPCTEQDRQRSGTPHNLAARLQAADNAQDHEDLSETEEYKTIAFHGLETSQEMHRLADEMDLDHELTKLLKLAARLHDLGKAHPIFQETIEHRHSDDLQARRDLAKAPQETWRSAGSSFRRPGFRHELASTLGILEALYQTMPLHPGLLGRHRQLIDLGLLPVDREHLQSRGQAAQGIVAEVAALDAQGLDLLLYLICAHHGKIRGSWQATPQDQEERLDPTHGLPLRGIRAGDRLPMTPIANANATTTMLPEVELHLDPAELGLSGRYGQSWRERVHGLRHRYGDSTLVLLESLLRIADIRASQRRTPDPWLREEKR